MKRRPLTEAEKKKLSNVIGEKIETETFVINDDGYVYFRCYDEFNDFTIGENRFVNIATSRNKTKTKDFQEILEILNNY